MQPEPCPSDPQPAASPAGAAGALRMAVLAVNRDASLDSAAKKRAIDDLYKAARPLPQKHTPRAAMQHPGSSDILAESQDDKPSASHTRSQNNAFASSRPNSKRARICSSATSAHLSASDSASGACSAHSHGHRDGHVNVHHGDAYSGMPTDENGIAWVCPGRDSRSKAASGDDEGDDDGGGNGGRRRVMVHASPPGVFPGAGAPPCEHYERKAWLKAACCGRYYPCRFCHDAAEDHEIDRHATKLVGCSTCGAADQPASESCGNCGVRFAAYVCGICVFYDDAPGKDIYHCDRCGLCRVGKGLGVDNYHCDRCNSCVPLDVATSHPCMERSLECNCPICSEYMATSREQVVFMRCGHAMHANCFSRHTATRYTCPICSKSLTNMDSWYRALDERLAAETTPPSFLSKRSRIYCNDCDLRSTAKYHFMFHRCHACAGYNTRVLSHFDTVEGVVDEAGPVDSGAECPDASASGPSAIDASAIDASSSAQIPSPSEVPVATSIAALATVSTSHPVADNSLADQRTIRPTQPPTPHSRNMRN
jgi:hypothetical protein